jgi:hypothetical protein
MSSENDLGESIIQGLKGAIAFEQGALAARVSIRKRPPRDGSVESALASDEILRQPPKKPRPNCGAQRDHR